MHDIEAIICLWLCMINESKMINLVLVLDCSTRLRSSFYPPAVRSLNSFSARHASFNLDKCQDH